MDDGSTNPFATFSTGARVRIDQIVSVTKNGSRIFVNGTGGELLAVAEAESPEDAQLELEEFNRQMDRWLTRKPKRGVSMRRS